MVTQRVRSGTKDGLRESEIYREIESVCVRERKREKVYVCVCV